MRPIAGIIFDSTGCLADESGVSYPDAGPALAELRRMGIKLCLVSPGASGPNDLIDVVGESLASALDKAALPPAQAAFLTGTAEGLELAASLGVQSILMMNDPDEALKLAARNPSAGVVSLLELPDLVRFVRAQAGS